MLRALPRSKTSSFARHFHPSSNQSILDGGCREYSVKQCPACCAQSSGGGVVAGHVVGLVRAARSARAAADSAGQAPPRPARRAGAVGERQRRVCVQPSAPGLASAVLMATGIRVRHSRHCSSHEGGRCSCKPTYQAQAYDTRTGRQVWRTFPTLTAAKLWRQDAQVALRRGTMRPPTAKTIAEAAEVLITGAHDGTILDRGGKPYKPSTARGYEQLLRSYVVPALGGWKLCRSSAATFRTSSTTCASRACPPRPSRTSSIRCASSSGGRSAGTRSRSIRLTTSTSPRSAAGATVSSRPRSRTSCSPRCPTARRRSGQSRSSAACAAASCAASSGSTSTSRQA